MRLDPRVPDEPRPIRRLSRKADPAADGAKSPGKTSHFLEPRRLSAAQKAATEKALRRGKVGDEASRRLFIGAIEYELAELPLAARDAMPAPPPEPARADPSPPPMLRVIAQSAQELARLLDGLPGESRARLLESLCRQDELCRGYDQRYLDQLQCEIGRIVNACALQMLPAGEPPPRRAAPEASPELRRFAASLANVFEECFEQTPTADPQGPFAGALSAIAEGVGVDIPRDGGFLRQALGQPRQ